MPGGRASRAQADGRLAGWLAAWSPCTPRCTGETRARLNSLPESTTDAGADAEAGGRNEQAVRGEPRGGGEVDPPGTRRGTRPTRSRARHGFEARPSIPVELAGSGGLLSPSRRPSLALHLSFASYLLDRLSARSVTRRRTEAQRWPHRTATPRRGRRQSRARRRSEATTNSRPSRRRGAALPQ